MRSRSSASALAFALALSATLALGACGSDEPAPDGDAALTVYVSLPLSGPAAGEGNDAADGARLALADAPSEIDGYAIDAEFLDAGASPAGWNPARSAANAREATRDSSAIAYIGDFQSGATRASLPITNGARLLQVSPASGATDLVVEDSGSDDVPAVQDSGSRSFGRVVPSDSAQAAAAAAWVADDGARRVCVEAGESAFARGMAAEFRGEAEDLGVDVDSGGLPCAGPFYSPEPPSVDGGGFEPGHLIASDAAISPQGKPLVPPRARITSAALDPGQLPAAGQEFASRFSDEYGRKPGRYAAYGYEAMALALDAVERAGDPADRIGVIDAFFETSARDSVLGPFSITETGETTLDRMSGYLATSQGLRPAPELRVP